jgi:ABC-type glycerol-3-phosphate transport system substrate-binding protein
VITVVAAALGLGAAACSSSPAATSSSGGHVTISVDCAPPASAPAQHKEWNEDVAIFEKENPNITINSIYENPCEVPASFTAMPDSGTEPNVFYTYFTDKNQVLDAGQAADITRYVNPTTVPDLKDIVPTATAAVTAGQTLYGRQRGGLRFDPGPGRAAGAAHDALRRPQHEPHPAAGLGHPAEADGGE